MHVTTLRIQFMSFPIKSSPELIYFAAARPTVFLPRSYTEYHFRRNASPRIAKGPTGSGKSYWKVSRLLISKEKYENSPFP
jgi:hypothetical protein